MPKAKTAGRIYVPELNISYESTAEAARDLGIDASNIAKVLRGKRKAAGGFTFVRNPGREEIAQLQEQQKKLKAAAGTVTGGKAKKAQASQEAAKARRDLLDRVHRQLVALNKQQKIRKKAGTLDADEAFKAMMQHADYYGYNKQGGYETSLKHLRQFTNTELENLLSMISQDTKTADTDAGRNVFSYALQFGISANDMDKYMYLVPLINEIFALSSGIDNYDSVKQSVYDAMQDGEDPAQLQAFLIDAKNSLQGNTAADLTNIIGDFNSRPSQNADFWDTYGD